MRGRRGGLRTSIPMHQARAMAHGFLDRVGGPFNKTAIVTHFRRWLKGAAQVASYQDEVGTWHDFLKGYICHSWSKQQEIFYRMQEKDPIQDTGELWTAALIGFIWQWTHQLWNKRNEETHKADGNRGSAREKLEAESRTRALYEQASQLIVEDREMFAMPLDQRLQQPVKSLLAWVAQVTPTVKVGLQEAQARIRDKIRDIREFFKPTILLRAVRGLNGVPAAPKGAKTTLVVMLCGYSSIHTSAGPSRDSRRRSCVDIYISTSLRWPLRARSKS